ncbi:MAG TPA: hypothetical protein VEK56_15045, partial [Vicinamibacterales bacterium]|nr:hypothetical protein [Vicinamibacterales bacterium]
VFDHGYTLYRQALQVPLLFVAPGRMPAARRVTAPVTLRDVPSTIVDVITRGADAPFPGVSLASFWNGTTTRADVRQSVLLSEVSRVTGQPPWFPASKGDMKAAFYRQFHYIRNADGTEELYDVDSDQAELHGLQERPEYQGALVESRAALQNVIERSPRHVRAR